MKRKLRLFLLLPMTILASCNQKKVGSENFALSYKKGSNGYFIVLSRHNQTYTTEGGSLGVRFDKNEFRADDPIFKDYTTVEEVNGVLLAKGQVASNYGTTIDFIDSFKVVSNRLLVNREFSVTNAGEDFGFMVEQKWLDTKEGKIHDREGFIPASYYVNGNRSFNDCSTRMFFGGDLLVIPSDAVSVLMASSFKDGVAFAMLDTSSGYRETSIVDRYTVDSAYLHIDENFNFSGIALSNEENNRIAYNYLYPAYKNANEDSFNYRLLPVEKGLKRKVSYSLFIDKFNSYNEMYTSMWRSAYDVYRYLDKRYQMPEVYETLLKYVRDSYSDNNIWGPIPLYFTNADHYHPDSGFLFRNLEMGMFMIKYGRKTNDQTTIDNALKVINYQLDNDSIDARLQLYTRDSSVFKRTMFDGLTSTVNLYAYLKTTSFGDEVMKTLMEKLFNYITVKAELYKNETSLMALSFYSRLYQLKDLLFLDYDQVALRLAEAAIAQTKEYSGYFGAIENKDTRISVAEDYMLLLRGLMTIYETNHNTRYLREAIRLANYLETFNVLTPMNMNPVGATGAEGYNFGFIGNERFLGNGYAFNNTNHGILDCPTSSTVVEYMKLYKYTGDQHYLDFAEFKFINSLLYVNMGDKVGHMDDPLHSSGNGFINEFCGNATTIEGYRDGGMRGAVHDSIIPWNVYELLVGFEYLKENNYPGFAEDYSLSHNLARNKVVTIANDNLAHSVAEAFDNLEDSFYFANEASEFILDLNEQCHIDSIEIEAEKNLNVYQSSNNIDFEEITNLTNLELKTRYIKFVTEANNKINNIQVNGYPVHYQDLAVDSLVLNNAGSMRNAIDKSNYQTIWNAGSSQETHILTLDLLSECEIYQTALMFSEISSTAFKIETSLNGENYVEYALEAGDQDKYIFVNRGYQKARYVRLTILSSSLENILVRDFKVLGSR
ncbi:MAG: discoidin domain-containing protein [Bacilli bacterium]